MAFYQSGEKTLMAGRATARGDWPVPGGGRALMVSVAIQEGTKVGALRARLRKLLAGMLEVGVGMPSIEVAIPQMAMESRRLPNFETMRQFFAGQQGTDLLEAQTALRFVYAEIQTGMTAAELAEAFGDLEAESVRELAEKAFTDANRHSLVLRPAR